MSKSKSMWMLALAGLTVLGGAACSGDRKPAPGTSGNAAPSAPSSSSSSTTDVASFGSTLHVNAVQAGGGTYVFDTAGVERLPVGDVAFSFTNSDTVPHEARVIRVNDGNLAAYRAALDADGVQGVAALGTQVAALGPNDPAKTTTTTITLDAGVYVIVDFLSAPDGKVFAQEGLLRELLVVAG